MSGPLIPPLAPGDSVEIDASGLRPLGRRPGAAAAEPLNAKTSRPSRVRAGLRAGPGGPSMGRPRLGAGATDRFGEPAASEPPAALALGIAFGIHEPLSDDVRTSLQDAGLIHVVVVSGLEDCAHPGSGRCRRPRLRWSRRRTLLVALPVGRLCTPAAPAQPQFGAHSWRERRCSPRRRAAHRPGADARARRGADARESPALVGDPVFSSPFWVRPDLVLLRRWPRGFPDPACLSNPSR